MATAKTKLTIDTIAGECLAVRPAHAEPSRDQYLRRRSPSSRAQGEPDEHLGSHRENRHRPTRGHMQTPAS